MYVDLVVVLNLMLFFFIADFGYCAQIDKRHSKRTTLAGTPCWVKINTISGCNNSHMRIDGA